LSRRGDYYVISMNNMRREIAIALNNGADGKGPSLSPTMMGIQIKTIEFILIGWLVG